MPHSFTPLHLSGHICTPGVRRRHVLAALGGVALLGLHRGAAHAQPTPALLLMAGAGYKRPMEALCAAFTQATGVTVERSYGNLQQVFVQAKASGRVDVLVGDADFIDKARDLALPQRTPLGKGVMTMAWRSGLAVKPGLASLPPLEAVRALLADAALSVSMPNPQQAIYGHAAQQLLQAQGLWDGLQTRLKVVGTVPQVSAYLTGGQVDVGFFNLTEALAVQDKLGGFVVLPAGPGAYTEVEIVAAMPLESEHLLTLDGRHQFALFLKMPAAQDILKRAGL